MEDKHKIFAYDYKDESIDVVEDIEKFVNENGCICSIHSFDDDEDLIVVVSTKPNLSHQESVEFFKKEYP